MKKPMQRIFRITILFLVAGVSTVAFIILFPQRLFANKITYRKFTVCSNSKIDDNIKTVLDNALYLVERSELYDPAYRYNIILCYNSFYNKIDDKLLAKGPSARTTLNNVVVKVRIDPQLNRAFPTFHKPCETGLAELLAHEMIHCLQANKYGLMKFNPFRHPEFWKLEGYPEYISRKKERSGQGRSLKNDIDRYISLKSKSTDFWVSSAPGGCEVPDVYYKGKLLIEYLMDIKHLSYDQILKDTISENAAFREMINWNHPARQ
jgi:hypothetical protein